MITVKIRRSDLKWSGAESTQLNAYREWCRANAGGWKHYALASADRRTQYVIFEFTQEEDALAFKIIFKEAI